MANVNKHARANKSTRIISGLFSNSAESNENNKQNENKQQQYHQQLLPKISTENQPKIYYSRLWFHLQLLHFVVSFSPPVKVCTVHTVHSVQVHIFSTIYRINKIFVKKCSNSLRLSNCVFSTSFICLSICLPFYECICGLKKNHNMNMAFSGIFSYSGDIRKVLPTSQRSYFWLNTPPYSTGYWYIYVC